MDTAEYEKKKKALRPIFYIGLGGILFFFISIIPTITCKIGHVDSYGRLDTVARLWAGLRSASFFIGAIVLTTWEVKYKRLKKEHDKTQSE